MPAVSARQQRYVYWRASQGDAWAKRWLAEGHTKPVKRKCRKIKGKRVCRKVRHS